MPCTDLESFFRGGLNLITFARTHTHTQPLCLGSKDENASGYDHVGNATITHHRPIQGTVRKRQRTMTAT